MSLQQIEQRVYADDKCQVWGGELYKEAHQFCSHDVVDPTKQGCYGDSGENFDCLLYTSDAADE